jgi:hypothetical protein
MMLKIKDSTVKTQKILSQIYGNNGSLPTSNAGFEIECWDNGNNNLCFVNWEERL